MKSAILFLDQQSWLGGAQRVLEAVIGSLGEEFDPIVAFPDHGAFRTALASRGIETITSPIGTYRSGRKSRVEMAVFAFRSVICGLRLAALIRRRQVALVYINGPRCLPAGVLAAWLTRRPSVFHLHLILKRRPEVLLSASLARYVSSIVACSQAAARSLTGADLRLSGKTQVLYNPAFKVDSEIRKRPEQERLTVGMVGRITETKGQRFLLNAVGNLAPQIRDRIRILIVGAPAPGCLADVRYAEDLQARVRQLGFAENVVWAGYRTDPGPCYSSMDVLVHAALDEAMCLVILEALQRGIPVIATRAGGIPEIVDEGSNSLLVTPRDEAGLGVALARFVEDESLRERLKSGARRGCLDDRFSFGNFCSKIRTLVCRLCNPADSGEVQAPDHNPAASS